MNRSCHYFSFCGLMAIATCFLLTACGRQTPETPGPDAFVSPGPPHPDELRIGSVIGGGIWSFVEWYASSNILAAQPQWDGLSKEAPLSVQRACEIALAGVRKEVPQVRTWLVESIYARNLIKEGGTTMFSYPNVWCYQITFTPSDPAERAKSKDDGFGFAMTQIVLMDGTLVPPTVIRKG